MKVIEYLKTHTFDQLKTQYAIKYNQDGDLICLKYNQLDSPKTHPIVRECRGLIIANGEVVCQPFYRFFNHEEGGDVINLQNCTVQEKHDGSLISLYWYGDKWNVSTSGTPTANCSVGDWDRTFAQLFWEAFEDRADMISKNCTYTFELCSPFNKVVRAYARTTLYLLGIRDRDTGHELSKSKIDEVATFIDIERPAEYELSDIDGILDSFAGLHPTDEGYVAVDYTQQVNGNFPRCKIKNPAYVALHHMVDSLADSRRGLLAAILVGEVDEIKAYFPEYTEYLEDYAARLGDWVDVHQAYADKVMTEGWSPQRIGRECIADGIQSSLIFAIYNGKVKSINEAVREGIKKKGIKGYSKNLLKTLDHWEIQ